MNLSPIRTAEDVDRAADQVIRAVSRGKLTPAEANTMMNLLESRSLFIERVKFETQLADLTAKVNAIPKLGDKND
jgi:hypothetical protein